MSSRYDTGVVADGVTLIQYILDADESEYPDPSPAGEVARIFCQTLIDEAERRHSSFEEKDISMIFEKANASVAEYNIAHGRARSTIDHWKLDFYAATAAFCVCKGSNVYWGALCDARFFHIDRNGKIIFVSPETRALRQAAPPQFEGDPDDMKARAMYAWKVLRNGMNNHGERIGYGVVTGEPESLNYLCRGTVTLNKGDIVGVMSDGYEHYLEIPEFGLLISEWPEDLETQIKMLAHKKAWQDPEKYGHERSLVLFNYE